MKITQGGKNKIINFNRHDAGDYHAWMILLEMKKLNKPKPIICEIGGGFGGLISKIKFKKFN